MGKMVGDLHWVGKNRFSEVTLRAEDLSPFGEIFWADRTDFCLERILQSGISCYTRGGKTGGDQGRQRLRAWSK